MKDLSSVEQELRNFPKPLVSEFEKVRPLLGQRLSPEEFAVWAEEGVAIARRSLRSWEAAIEYFKATPRVVETIAFPWLVAWARRGSEICQQSSELSCAYFRSSEAVLSLLSPHQIDTWADLGQGLYRGNWRSGAVATAFFELTPRLLRYLSLEELRQFVRFIIEPLGDRSYELAVRCLNSADQVFPAIEKEDRGSFLFLASFLVDTNKSDAETFFSEAPVVLSRIAPGGRAKFLAMARRIASTSSRKVLPFLFEGSRALGELHWALHPHLLELSQELIPLSCSAVVEFLKGCPSVLERIKPTQLEEWFREGASILAESEQGGVAYFRLETNKGVEVLERLSCGLDLERAKDVLRMYCQALTGKNIQILPAHNLAEKGIGWAFSETSSTEGTDIFLPSFVNKYGAKGENFGWYKVLVTHQAAHLEFGSFDFSFEKPANLFADLRPGLAQEAASANAVTDLQRFFDLFDDRKLATDIFTVVEDSRVDYRVKHEYQGIAKTYQRVQEDALTDRPSLRSLPLREAFLEILLQMGMGEPVEVAIPSLTEFQSRLPLAIQILDRVQSPQAAVEDSAEATIRLYRILIQIPNVMAEAQWEESPYSSPRQVRFRGEFKPELVQTLMKLRESQKGSQKEASTISQEALKELLKKSSEIEIKELSKGDISSSSGLFVSNLMKEAARKQASAAKQKRKKAAQRIDVQSLERDEPLSFLYDEWDFRANDYRPRWCRVRQRNMTEGTADFFERTLENNFGLAAQIRKQFELLSPQVLRKMKKLQDGEDFELDAVIHAIVEKRAGQSPTDKIYWKRNKIERDVSVVFLLDMSASTSEPVTTRVGKTTDPPNIPSDVTMWNWRNAVSLWSKAEREGMKTPLKRIIDVEKESAVLLIGALQTIGDNYGIYGFSGYGRENVEFYVIKDIEEEFSDRVKRRIDKISPVHATRMGPAIRHATAKLEDQESRTKILFLISDGRPQDYGYSRDGVEKEHAIHDTKMALTEAKRKNIIPFCLTVDWGGHGYLKTMCEDIGYEIVSDIESLPRRLPALYRRLTV